ncbi:MAG: VapE domain-containing protein [Polyangiaceae bacterium]
MTAPVADVSFVDGLIARLAKDERAFFATDVVAWAHGLDAAAAAAARQALSAAADDAVIEEWWAEIQRRRPVPSVSVVAPRSGLALPDDSTTIAHAAEMYAQLGFEPLPLWGLRDGGACTCRDLDCDSQGKHPVHVACQQHASSDIDIVRQTFRSHRGNIGLLMGSRYVALDADGEEGMASLASLGELPPTLTAATGSGKGEHRIFRLAANHDASEIPNRKALPKLDVKVRNGQIVVAPSLHLSGNRYRWTVCVEPALLPDHIYERIRERKVVPIRVPAPSSSPTAGDVLKRATAYMATLPPAISGSGGHDQTFDAARRLVGWMAKGLAESDAWRLLVDYNATCQPPWSEKELEHKFAGAKGATKVPDFEDRAPPGRAAPSPPPPAASAPPPDGPAPPAASWSDLLVTRTGTKGQRIIVKHAENVVVILRHHPAWAGKIRWDLHAQQTTVRDPPWHQSDMPGAELLGRPWSDEDTARLSAWVVREMGLEIGVSDCDRAVAIAAAASPYHPVRDWMAELRWDGQRRLDTWLASYLGAPATAYASAVGRWWLTAAVARTYRPGCKADNVLILEGEQGLKKSSALRTLAGTQWFSDTAIDLHSKDAYLGLQGKLIVELAELDSLRRADATRAKAFFTSEVDSYRPPYGRRTVHVPRGCVFAGTTNGSNYLQDRTGNRRFWPVECRRIDLEALARDRELLWAEAVAAFEGGAPWWPESEDERVLCEEQQEPRAEGDEWEGLLLGYITRVGERDFTVSELLKDALGLEAGKWGRGEQMRVASGLQSLGYVRVRLGSRSDRRWVYRRVQTIAGGLAK